MIIHRLQQGFTAVELLVAIMVGVALLGISYQLYSVSLSSSGDAQRRTQASMAAYDILRSRQLSVPASCVGPTSSTQSLASSTGLPGATATTTINCLNTTDVRMNNLTLITVTVNYDNNTRQVSRAITVLAQ